MNKGVFWAVLAALLVFSLIVAVSDGVRRYLAWHAVDEMMRQMSHQSAAETARARQQQQQLQAVRLARQRADLRARTLAPDQQCVSGTVVTVRPQYASQVIRHGQPVPCTGRLAQIPLR